MTPARTAHTQDIAPDYGDIVYVGKWIRINKLPLHHKRKYHQYEIIGPNGMIIGHIAFYGGWRQFVLIAHSGSVWSASCLREIQTFLKSLNGGR